VNAAWASIVRFAAPSAAASLPTRTAGDEDSHVDWSLLCTGADVRIEIVAFPSSDRGAIRKSEREVDALLTRALGARDAGARRVLEEV